MWCSGAAQRQMNATAGRWGHAFPRMYGHTDTIPSLLWPQGSALNSIFFFSDMASSIPARRGPH